MKLVGLECQQSTLNLVVESLYKRSIDIGAEAVVEVAELADFLQVILKGPCGPSVPKTRRSLTGGKKKLQSEEDGLHSRPPLLSGRVLSHFNSWKQVDIGDSYQQAKVRSGAPAMERVLQS